jgi:hypothetical protein
MKQKNILFMLALGGILIFTPKAHAKDGDQETRGRISALSNSSISVNLLTCSISSNTEFENSNSQPIAQSNFNIGDEVKLKCRNLVAKNVEMKSENNDSSDDNGGDDSSNGGNNGGGSNDSKYTSRLKSNLSAPVDVSTLARGTVTYRLKRNGSKRDDQFKISVKIPIPSTLPAVESYRNARALSLTATLKRNSVAFATCSLRIDGRSRIASTPAAEFKLDAQDKRSSSKGRSRFSKGSCDIDLATAGVQRGLPIILAGDSLEVSETSSGIFLAGVL